MSGSDITGGAPHRLRFLIEAGVRVCLWAQDEPTKARLGYAVWLDQLDLPQDIVDEASTLMKAFDHAMAAHDPGGEVETDSGPIVFGYEDDAPFRDRVVRLVGRLREALGPGFVIETDFES